MRKSAKLTHIDEGYEIATELQLDSFDNECARLCFQKLPDDKRLLLEQYYSGEGGHVALAEQMGLSIAGLRTKIHRVKAELKQCYRKCMRGSA